jgi:hypothetical protein
MPIAVIYRPPAMTSDQYKRTWTDGPPVDPPSGLIFHAGIGEGDAFFTVTVWTDRDAYDSFAPLFTKLMNDRGFHFGKPEILPVHQVLTGSAPR